MIEAINGLKPLTIITKRSILDVAAVLDPALVKVKCVMFPDFAYRWSLCSVP